MKNRFIRVSTAVCLTVVLFCFATIGHAELEYSITKYLTLEDTPRAIVLARDGATAYILCNDQILVYSVNANKVTNRIPLANKFSEIAISPDGMKLFLTGADKKLSVMRVSQIVDISIGNSALIGPVNAPVTLFVFMDYQ